MSGLEFLSSIIGALAWPAALGTMVWALREEVKALLSRELKSLRLGRLELEYFDSRFAKLKSNPRIVEASSTGGGKVGLVEELSSLAEVSPRTAVLEAYARLLGVIRQLVETVDSEKTSRTRLETAPLVAAALDQGVLDADGAKVVETLSIMRHIAAHGSGLRPSQEEAVDFLALVDAVISLLRQGEGRGSN